MTFHCCGGVWQIACNPGLPILWTRSYVNWEHCQEIPPEVQIEQGKVRISSCPWYLFDKGYYMFFFCWIPVPYHLFLGTTAQLRKANKHLSEQPNP